MLNTHLKREGDINSSPQRTEWMNQLNQISREVIQEDERVFVRQSMSTPCLNGIVDAYGSYLIDVNGNKYLDFHGNSSHQVGYKNPYVVDAIKRQVDELPFIPRRFTSEIVIKAANALVNKTTSKDYKVLFTPSGSAAVGLALKIARKVTGRHKVISMWESFHGAGLDAISVGGEYVFKKDMGPLMPGTLKAIPFNGYRNLLKNDLHEEVANFCLDHIEYMIAHEGEIGAILLEPIRATDTHIPPKSYFKRLREICDRNGILLIFDEVPTALMRSGAFYVHQNFEIEPDILVLGKGLGGAVIPQAAVLTRTKYDVAEEISLGHYTHEKPALGCAAICSTIEYIDDYNLEENCRVQSEFVKTKLVELYDQYEKIGDIRVAGLLISIELVKSRETKEKNDELAEKILYFCLNNGLSFKLSGGNCITWHPPLIVTKNELEFAVGLLEEGLKRFS
ncbi:aspartate aminotransferase family protein [Gottfriedia acidiceleris]|uniref:(R)-1-hydroxy-2-aminoethylphosphonate ammonia-lyase n=1 Tax=Bacillaceae TaxID=186817 RepID=UPI000BEDB7AD|nr:MULTISPECIES: aspartate aminotransferase family protein [unclassified Bacillus (in: firmicutes)]PEC48024.1 aspartate aminotransferase family protein [Bacillus sp. AFS096315]PFM83283.1 aspartate aminotransferase family protein [Bacillus sp. AFS077874]